MNIARTYCSWFEKNNITRNEHVRIRAITTEREII